MPTVTCPDPIEPKAPCLARGSAPSPIPVTVMSWNILEGIHHPNVKGNLPALDVKRLAYVRTVIAELHPDVLILNEALWARPVDGHHVNYAKLLGFNHGVGDTYDGVWGNAILSRFPLVSQERFRIHNRGGLRVTIQAAGWQLEVATYHPHPDRRPFKKAEDFTELLGRAPLDHPFLIAGDFNAISPVDQPDLTSLAAGFARFSKDPERSASRFIESGKAIFPVLHAHGLREAVPESGRQFSIPTDLISLDKGSAMRLDHVWVNGHLEVRGAAVVHHPAAGQGSDHYPVWATVAPAHEPSNDTITER